jgi:hypothetical protein
MHISKSFLLNSLILGLFCAVIPISGNITSLGIGRNNVSNNAALNTAGYTKSAIHYVILSTISMNNIC